MAPNNNNNNSNNPFERLFRPFFGSDDDGAGGRSDDIFANFPERANLPYNDDNGRRDSLGRFPDWMMAPSGLHSSAFQWSTSSSYQLHQDHKEVSIEVDMPGVAGKDLKVEVLQGAASQSCTVQWSGERADGRRRTTTTATTPGGRDGDDDQARAMDQLMRPPPTFSNRIRLGPHVDCDRLTAHLSRGVLHLRAPVKAPQEDVPAVRSIPITED